MGGTPYWVDPDSSYMHFMNFLAKDFDWGTYFGWPQTIIQMQHFGAASLVAGILVLAPFRWLLATRPFRFLGRISFMLYLLQLPVLCTVAVRVFLTCPADWGYEPRAVVAFLAFIVVTVLAATLGARFVDQPCTLLSRQITARSWDLDSVVPVGFKRWAGKL